MWWSNLNNRNSLQRYQKTFTQNPTYNLTRERYLIDLMMTPIDNLFVHKFVSFCYFQIIIVLNTQIQALNNQIIYYD